MSIFDRKKKQDGEEDPEEGSGEIVKAKGKTRGKPFALGADARRNLGGRPHSGDSLSERLRDIMDELHVNKGTDEEMSALDAGILALITKFLKGNEPAARLLFDRGWGKIPETLMLSQVSQEEEGDFSLIPFPATKLIEYWLWITEGSKPAPATIEDTKRKEREEIQRAINDSKIIELVAKYTDYRGSLEPPYIERHKEN